MLRILYCWGELLCDAWTRLWRGEKFPITVFCLQRGLNWIYAQCWNLGLQIWILPKAGLTHLCHSRVIPSHKTCFAVILCLKPKYDIFSEHVAETRSMVQTKQQLCLCASLPRADYNSPYPLRKGIYLRLLDNKRERWGSATTYEREARGLIAAAGRNGLRGRQKKMCQRKRMRYFHGEAGWHQIHPSEL